MPEFLDMSASPMSGKIQGNLIAYMSLFAGLPNMVMVYEDVYWFVSNKDAPGNCILRTNWSNADAEKKIDSTLAEISKHIDQISWWVYPDDKPVDLGKRLEARGMPGGRGGNWLWADLKTLIANPIMPPNFHIERVRDDQMMAEWTRVSGEGFGNNDLGCFYDAYARHGYGDDAFSLHYIGYLDNVAVTSGTLLDAGGGASIYDISTPPAYRRQGFGMAITYFLMGEIRKRGYHDTWIWSSDMAKSGYKTLSYVDADFGLREHKWKK